MADKFSVGDVVRVTMSREFMKEEFGYEGNYDKDMVATVSRVAGGCTNFRLEGEEHGFCTWIKHEYAELVDEVVVQDDMDDTVVELDTGLTPFGELDSSKKAMLLLDHHEGKTIQMWLDTHWWDNPDPDFDDYCVYRTKPQALIDAENAITASEARTAELKDELERLSASL